MNLSMKQIQTHKENRLTVAKGEAWQGKEGLGAWGQQMETSIYRTEKQQGPSVQNRELYSMPCDKPQWKRT